MTPRTRRKLHSLARLPAYLAFLAAMLTAAVWVVAPRVGVGLWLTR